MKHIDIVEELRKVYNLGCDCVQGYYYAHPLGLNDYLNFVENPNKLKEIES